VGRESRAKHLGGVAILFVLHIAAFVSKACRLEVFEQLGKVPLIADGKGDLGDFAPGRVPAERDGWSRRNIILAPSIIDLFGSLGIVRLGSVLGIVDLVGCLVVLPKTFAASLRGVDVNLPFL
jgi:hypothetical protein